MVISHFQIRRSNKRNWARQHMMTDLVYTSLQTSWICLRLRDLQLRHQVMGHMRWEQDKCSIQTCWEHLPIWNNRNFSSWDINTNEDILVFRLVNLTYVLSRNYRIKTDFFNRHICVLHSFYEDLQKIPNSVIEERHTCKYRNEKIWHASFHIILFRGRTDCSWRNQDDVSDSSIIM